MTAIYAVGIDRRRAAPRVLASVTISHFGPSVATSDDLGHSWQEPDHAPVAFPEDTGATLERVWQFAPASVAEPEVVYAGSQPSALFRSGFPMVAHPVRAGVIYNFPLVRDGERYPVDHRCRVFRSADAGKSWEPLSDGLPDEPYYPSVLRDAMRADDADPAGVYFGTRSDEVYASRDEGDSWSRVAAHLPDVLCVRAAEV